MAPLYSRPPQDVAGYEDGVERLSAAVESAVRGEGDWEARVAAGLGAGLEFLAADSALAQVLLTASLATTGPARLEHERSLIRLTEALRPPAELPGGETIPEETVQMLAGGLISRVAGRVLKGEAEQLPEDHDLLLRYLFTPGREVNARVAAR